MSKLSSKEPTKVRWLILLLSCFTSWFLYLHRYTWNFVSEGLAEDYGMSSTQTGWLASCFNITYGIGQIPSGVISDLIGPHFFLGIIIAAWSLILPLVGLSGNRYLLGGVQLAFGAAQAGAYPNLARVTKNWWPLKTRTIAQGTIATFFGRGGGAMSSIIMATLLMGALNFTWQQSLWIMGAAGAIFAAIFLALFRSTPEDDNRVNEAEVELIREGEVPPSEKSPVLPVGKALKNRSLQFFVMQQFLNAGADIVFLTTMGKFFKEAKGVEMFTSGILVSLPLWGGAVGGMLGGFCNDFLIRVTGSRRWGRSIVGFTGKFLACILMFVTISQGSPEGAAIALFAVKFFSDWSQPTVWGTSTDLGGKYSATVFSIINTSGTLGGIVFPPVFGMILDYNTVNGVANFNPLFVTVAGMYIISAFCWFLINCTDSLDRK